MSDDKTGGPAFPLVAQNWHKTGMTLRDYFAAQAMVAIFNERCLLSGDLTFEQAVANKSYEMADAMMAQRLERNEVI